MMGMNVDGRLDGMGYLLLVWYVMYCFVVGCNKGVL